MAKRRSTTLTVSLLVHSVLALALIVVPLLFDEYLPAPTEAVRAFFVTPAVATPPPPPPPPPAPGVRPAPRTPVAPQPEEPARFVAPMETPSEVMPDEGLSLGVEGGVPGGVEGGVPGGVIGGIVGGLPTEAPPPPRVVRVGGQLKAPKLLHRVQPDYPELAKQARLSAIVIVEAMVGTDGRVESVNVLRGQPLFDDTAVAAVRQWRYKPLLLNGVPTPFILTVTLVFNIKSANSAGS
ncbi:MAG TPA: energy transducer TonB [Vicinamibacteria bacterium]|nr:energy transducer TonB [Vicinamibacteria bacterium]